VSLRRWNDIWLNEGFATYAEWLWRARHGGPSTHKIFLREFRATTDWSVPPADPTPRTLFSNSVYLRGAMTLEALRDRIGSRTFFRVLHRWTHDHRHGNGTTVQFKRLAEHVSGKQLDRLFRDWLFATHKPRGYVG
jgi:aminopeptidase N